VEVDCSFNVSNVEAVQALLPVLLRSGEEAFNEIRDRDDFGKAKDALDRDRRNKK
jgi:hypothetical protein